MRRNLFTEDHEAFRQLARDFIEKEVAPHYPDWEKAGRMPREVFEHMGSLGMLGMAIPEQYGGSGIDDYRYNVVLQEEAARALVTLSTVRTQLDVILPYFLHYANDEQRERWFPGLAAGTLLTAVAMTEPGTGSDLRCFRRTYRNVPLRCDDPPVGRGRSDPGQLVSRDTSGRRRCRESYAFGSHLSGPNTS